MKRVATVVLFVLLVMPVVSFAGSATSRWDLTVGGWVKFDMGYNTQAQGVDIAGAARSGYGAYQTAADRYGNFYSYAGATGINFLTKGPDAWGAKTMAFVEGHFRGNEEAAGAGTFGLRHAFMQLDWPNSKLTIGQTWQLWGFLPTFAGMLLNYNDLGPFNKGMRQPLIRFEQNLTKNWSWSLGAISPTNTLGSNIAGMTSSGVVDSYTRSGMPFWEGEIQFKTDKCGVIGMWPMLFALDGFYGRQKQIAAAGGTATSALGFTSKDVDSWGMAFKGFIPIIPQKQGNKKGAFMVSGQMFYAQNPGFYMSPTQAGNAFNANYSYNNIFYTGGNNTVPVLTPEQAAALDYSSPVQYGGWGQASYYLTDSLWVNGWYGYVRANVSDAWRLINAARIINPATASVNGDAIVNTTQIVANILYDVNQAIRFGFQYSWYSTRYANYAYSGTSIIGTKDGTAQSFRIGAYYFF